MWYQEGGSLIAGRFVYAAKDKPISAGRAKTGAYVGENRKLDARFFVKCPHEFVEKNAPAPTVQLQIIRVFLSLIAYRKWNFRAMGVSRAFSMYGALKSETYATYGHLKRETYAKLPDGEKRKCSSEAIETAVWDEYSLQGTAQ